MALMVVVVVQALPIYLSVPFFAFFSLVMRVYYISGNHRCWYVDTHTHMQGDIVPVRL